MAESESVAGPSNDTPTLETIRTKRAASRGALFASDEIDVLLAGLARVEGETYAKVIAECRKWEAYSAESAKRADHSGPSHAGTCAARDTYAEIADWCEARARGGEHGPRSGDDHHDPLAQRPAGTSASLP